MKTNFLTEVEGDSFVLFYGSQLGQAKSIAEGLVDGAEENGFRAKVFELNVIKDVNDLTKLKCPIVIITSTTGDGEPPESCDKFWRKIRRKALSATTLESVRYTLLGLGDTNYNNFCNCGKEFNRRFQDLGASLFYPPAWADDAVGLEEVVDDWIDNLWPALQNLICPGSELPKMAKTSVTVPNCPQSSLQLEWLPDNESEGSNSKVYLKEPLAPYPLIEGDPVSVRIKDARILTKPDALKTALELTLEFLDKSFKFEPGDAVNIVCPNPIKEVRMILERLGLSDKADRTLQLSVKEGAKGKIPAFLPATITLKSAFLYYFDIRSCPKKTFLRLLAEHATEESEKSKLLELCSRQGSTLFEETIRFPALSFLDILLTFPSCSPPLESLMEHLPRLAPRAYSISSSPLVDDKSFTFVFNIANFSEEDGRKYGRKGICTGWLYEKVRDRLKPDLEQLEETMEALKLNEVDNNDEIVIYRRKNQTFRLPESSNSKAPIIMVGPGTGVAPFLGFIQQRSQLLKLNKNETSGEMTLYFGCRHKARDFLYEKELESFNGNVLTKFYPVFSRDDPEASVKYVQHCMEENKKELVETLFDNCGYLYVCGDARNMAKDVRDTLIRCVKSVKEVPEAEAKSLVTDLSTQKRYLQDIWT